MAIHQDDFSLRGNFAPIRSEDDFELSVRGSLPLDLNGVLYRNGPNPQFEPRDANHHWFVGDGMIHAFAIEAGRVSYRNRWVKTNKWTRENTAGHALFGSWGNPMTTDPAVRGTDGGVANTNILYHGGRLLALEEAHAPFEIEERSLAPRGPLDLGGRVTAHPKIDPETGEMIFFAYADGPAPLSTTVSWGVVDRNGVLVRREHFEAPYCSMIHDFMVTEHYVLLPIMPLTGSLERVMRGDPAYAWEPEKPAVVGVMRRDVGVASLRWFTTDPCYFFHAMNAYEEAGTIVADVMKYPTPSLFPHADGRPGAPSTARLTRWTFDLSGATSAIRETPLDDLAGEFPRFDERRGGHAYRHGWIAATLGAPSENNASFDSLAHFDLATGRRTVLQLPEGDSTSEPIFVPRATEAEEGDGWLLAIVYRARDNVSDLVVLDARAIDAGPVAVATLPRRVPFGFHGNWVGA